MLIFYVAGIRVVDVLNVDVEVICAEVPNRVQGEMGSRKKQNQQEAE